MDPYRWAILKTDILESILDLISDVIQSSTTP